MINKKILIILSIILIAGVVSSQILTEIILEKETEERIKQEITKEEYFKERNVTITKYEESGSLSFTRFKLDRDEREVILVRSR